MIALALGILAIAAPISSLATPDASPATTPARPVKHLDIPIPINYAAKGLRIPSRDGNGQVRMFFNIDATLRVDDGHLRMTGLRIETYDDAGKPDLNIDMPISLLDLKTNLISSTDPVTIRRADFKITGANATFDPQSRQGKFSGPVRMLIFNRAALDQKPAADAGAAASQGTHP